MKGINKWSDATAFIKFVSFDDELLIGHNQNHIHLLQQHLGIDYFPQETIAIGTMLLEGDEITQLSFDFGNDADRQIALRQIKDWCDENFITISPNLSGFFKRADTEEHYEWLTAFAFIDGQLHIGQNHPAILTAVEGVDYGDEDFRYELMYGDTIDRIFGRVVKEDGVLSAQIYSDFYKSNYDEAELQELLVQLRKRWPVTEITYGPDPETIAEMEGYFDNSYEIEDPRTAALSHIAKWTGM